MLAIAVTDERGVLVIRVNHDNDVGALSQSLAVAGLLVTPVTVIAVVDEVH